ncbi:hypothetical protein CIPAW_03G149900 [Carya illinoinensis]|uniref:Uncharacterized protein n=1 Tax=Carya illinoinensis TaxID=32201 RepID=A0A8T1R3W8_CARIL|nr:hypothetical protein CIPAW_03G149900 [Carya illinoinensis]
MKEKSKANFAIHGPKIEKQKRKRTVPHTQTPRIYAAESTNNNNPEEETTKWGRSLTTLVFSKSECGGRLMWEEIWMKSFKRGKSKMMQLGSKKEGNEKEKMQFQPFPL